MPWDSFDSLVAGREELGSDGAVNGREPIDDPRLESFRLASRAAVRADLAQINCAVTTTHMDTSRANQYAVSLSFPPVCLCQTPTRSLPSRRKNPRADTPG
eukprot:COSAG02_NODE_6581_length_3479_cov_18.301479_2_plen_101_part_00